MNNNLLDVVDDGKMSDSIRYQPLSSCQRQYLPITKQCTCMIYFLSTCSLKSILHSHLTTNNNQSVSHVGRKLVADGRSIN